MSIHRAFWLALLAGLWTPQEVLGAEQEAPAAVAPAEAGEPVPDPALRGLPIGQLGLTFGGHVTGEIEDLEGEEHYSALEGNLFVFYAPVRYFRLFTDLELARDEIALERGYADVPWGDAVNVRLGKFLTPIGRWNQAHIEPLTWTTAEPVMIDTVFDDTISGVALNGTMFPSGGALSYSVYGSLVDAIRVDPDEDFAKRSAGGRLELASLEGWTAGVSYYASKPHTARRWHHLAGVDLLLLPHRRVEISFEGLAGEGSRAASSVYAGYVQAAVETWPSVHLVARVEALALPGPQPVARFVTTGLVWAPLPEVRFKTDYTNSNDAGESIGEPGLRLSLSYLF